LGPKPSAHGVLILYAIDHMDFECKPYGIPVPPYDAWPFICTTFSGHRIENLSDCIPTQ